MISLFRASPRLAWERYVAGLPRESPEYLTPSLVLGSAVNQLILEPESSGIYVAEAGSRNSKAYRDAVLAWPDRLVLTQPEYTEAANISAAIREPRTNKARLARSLLLTEGGYSEYAHRWSDPTGVRCKCMVDRLVEIWGKPTILEMKTTNSPDPKGFGRSFLKFNYHRQAACNLRGIGNLIGEEPAIYIIVVGNEPPYEVDVRPISETLLTEGKRLIQEDLERLAVCIEDRSGESWQQPWEQEEELTPIEPPDWLKP